MKNKKRFTLLEMIVVVAIIALLAAIVTPMYFKHIEKAKATAAKTQIMLFEQSIIDYQLDTGKLPRSLNDLMMNTYQDKKWDGPYLSSNVPLDPWGNEYVFVMPGKNKSFDIYSFGNNGPSGGSSSEGVIGNWNK